MKVTIGKRVAAAAVTALAAVGLVAVEPASGLGANLKLEGDWGPLAESVARLAICATNDYYANGTTGGDNGKDCATDQATWTTTFNPSSAWGFYALRHDLDHEKDSCISERTGTKFISCWHVTENATGRKQTFSLLEANPGELEVLWYVQEPS